MCEFCENKKEQCILSYDNHKNMNVCMDQYQGVMVYSSLYMNGNMLSLDGHGNYRSCSDCYYESEGLDCDGVYSKNSQSSYMKIKYCPFCGKEIKSTIFEKQETEDKINELQNKVHGLKNELSFSQVHINVKLFKVSSDEVEEKKLFGYKKNNGILFEDLFKYFDKNQINIKLIYGINKKRYIYNDSCYPTLNPDTKMYSGNFCCDELYFDTYVLKDSLYKEYINKGLIKGDEEKYKKLQDHQIEISNKIKEVNKEIKNLKTYLKTL